MASGHSQRIALNAAWAYSSRIAPSVFTSEAMETIRKCLRSSMIDKAREHTADLLRLRPSLDAFVSSASMERKLRAIPKAVSHIERALCDCEPLGNAEADTYSGAHRLLLLRSILDFERGNKGAANAAVKLLKARTYSTGDRLAVALTESAMIGSVSPLESIIHIECMGDATVHTELARRLIAKLHPASFSHQRAMRLCQRGLILEPMRADLWLILAQSLLNLGHPVSSRAVLKAADEHEYLNTRALLKWADFELSEDGDIQLARSLLERASPHDSRAALRLAQLDINDGHRQNGTDQFKKLLRNDRGNARIWLLWAKAESEDCKRFRRILMMAIENCASSTCAPIYHALEGLERKENRLQFCRYWLGKALQVQPGHAPSSVALAGLDLKEGRMYAAYRIVTAALKIEPKNKPLLWMKERVDPNSDENNLSRKQKAQAARRDAYLDPDNPYAAVRLVNAYKKAGQSQEAIKQGKRALSGTVLQGRSRVSLATTIAYMLARKKKTEEALEMLEEAIGRFMGDAEMLIPAKIAAARVVSRAGCTKSQYLRGLRMLDDISTWTDPNHVKEGRLTRSTLARFYQSVKREVVRADEESKNCNYNDWVMVQVR